MRELQGRVRLPPVIDPGDQHLVRDEPAQAGLDARGRLSGDGREGRGTERVAQYGRLAYERPLVGV